MDFLNAYVHLDDVKVIRGLAKSRNGMKDSYGWSFIESRKYTVKTWCKVESLFPEKAHKCSLLVQILNFYWPSLRNLHVLRNWDILFGKLFEVLYRLQKSWWHEVSFVILGAVFVVQKKNQLTMFSLNANEHYKIGLCQKFFLLLVFFPPLWCLLIWIISSGDCQKSMILVTFYGHCGIFGKIEIIRFSIIGIEIHRKFSESLKWRVKYGQMCNLQFHKGNLWFDRHLTGNQSRHSRVL